MAEIITEINENRRAGFGRQKKSSVKTDMTTMVDLGFLLISFFVMTTELTRPSVLNLNMPKEDTTTNPTRLGESDALTVLLDKNNLIYYYHGKWEDAVKSNQLFSTSFSSIEKLRQVIREKQKNLDHVNKKEGRRGLMLLIKPGEESSYSNVVDMLDEALIHDVKKYAIVKMETEETNYIRDSKNTR